ncbi:MAG: DNA polymerase-3 subunit gamma/tau [Chloroflexi bacterium]|jgi:DNA polymerase-3 subunit gamma/tau|nr:MAG: DNA polymerase-3 subunit gamma/tau [Chloroflexota bacterium]
MDLIEIDAASNRGIDDIRNLREKVYYSPSQARYKVYIVDEVHMLTDPAFNALLKTLEEPPPHAIFVLATTESHKVPPTVISRCQRFDFRRISPVASVERLRVICESEGITATDDALWAISKSASGSLRDAINVLDQMIVSYGGEFGAAQVQELLGLGDEEGALRLMECVLAGELAEGLGVIHSVAMNGADLRQFHKQVVEYLRGALLVRSGAEGGLDHSVEALERLKLAAAGPDMNALVRAVRLFSQVDVRADVSSPLPLELALVEASLRAPSPVAQAAPATAPPTPQPQPASKPKAAESTPVASARPVPVAPAPPVEKKAEPAIAETSFSEAAAQEGSVQEPAPPSVPVVQQSSPAAVEQGIAKAPSAASVAGAIDTEALEGRWTELISALQRKKGRRFYLGGLMRDSRSHDLEDGVLILRFGSRSNMERLKEELQTPEGRKAMGEGMEAILGSQMEVRVEMAESVSEGPAQGGHLVRMALARGGRIVQESEAKTAEGQEDQPD